MSDLRAVLKTLCITYGPSAIQGTLDELVGELRRDIDLYYKAESNKIIPVAVPAPAPAPAPAPSKVEKESKAPIKEVKTTKEILKDLVVVKKQTESDKPLPTTNQQTADKFLRHKLLIEQRANQLKQQGLEAPYPMLTQDNMKQWIDKDGMTYWKIAEMVGASDKLVSAMAKLYNLQSNASKMIQFKKEQK